ncbi:39S ribosomal protein L37, mitochondrial [Yamadazyma tenuis]|uniref:Large ribosomal subunit protein mL54 n=1 Tax=Candida tenuis (strain ATCC 10573 / BCRC 21748 / CBS 615 / JCM 9827 / NBRC 10315 / NRRL Y-1498 / VKM Y-70) TaxID=590646 RepID=G3AYU6_CANTC|nr:uncharacterized protein CANTEDRAFT_101245 [Yamadazyma tenuis ATCC 10573]EGV65932.1 hypothetical protein CANTEDRAFT_101245 [Yamadazyma tenuis ATCC 10573]WEJ95736.1 39S ribosomal protein L37, mitochondrial [Yamadazyma tenuis]
MFRSLTVVRRFSISRSSLNTPKSSCVAGTVLNLKVKKAGDEPVALEDSDYPDWLWDSLDKGKKDKTLKKNDFMKWRRKQLNKVNTAKIKEKNFLSEL